MTGRVLEVVEAGVVPYAEALEWQRALAQARIEGRLANDVLLLLEHPAVVTLGRNSDAGHLLSRDGIEVFEIERGGDVTFHGPGQLIGYPIIDLTGHQRDLHWYLRTLEQALIDALAGLGICATRNPGYTGVMRGLGAISLVNPKHVAEFARRLDLLLHEADLRKLWRDWALQVQMNPPASLVMVKSAGPDVGGRGGIE